MSTFESKTSINRPLGDVYDFLSDFNNHQQLMPEDIQDWSSTYSEASFGVQNMVKLSLKIASRYGNNEIRIIPSGKPPFEIVLVWSLSPANDKTNITFTITAELDIMMKMVASGPLQKLVEHETTQLKAILG
jgi:carbon monoxide dehydrogenase subunit G